MYEVKLNDDLNKFIRNSNNKSTDFFKLLLEEIKLTGEHGSFKHYMILVEDSEEAIHVSVNGSNLSIDKYGNVTERSYAFEPFIEDYEEVLNITPEENKNQWRAVYHSTILKALKNQHLDVDNLFSKPFFDLDEAFSYSEEEKIKSIVCKQIKFCKQYLDYNKCDFYYVNCED